MFLFRGACLRGKLKVVLSKAETRVFFVGFLLWFAGDLVTTLIGFSLGFKESNPFFDWLTLETFWLGVLAKVLAGALIVFGVVSFKFDSLRTRSLGKVVWSRLYQFFCVLLIVWVTGIGLAVVYLNSLTLFNYLV